MKKRVLSILLCVIMLCGLLPTAALANNTATEVTFQVRTANGASGTVYYRFGDSGDFVTVTPNDDGAASIEVPSEATSVTVKAVPTGEYKVNQQQSGIWVNGNNTLTTDEGKTTFFTTLVEESGYTYTLTADTPQFVIEFDNNDGTGGNGSENGNQQQSDNIGVQFDTESIADNVATFTVNDISVTVTVSGADISETGTVSVPRNNLGGVTFTLGNTYDAATMQVIVKGSENYSSVLAVNNNTVSLDSLNIPDGGLHFSVEASGGGENPGENAASYSVDFGTGSWIVGGVTVTADKSGEQTLSESDIITLTGFDAETMEARVDAEDGFGTTLAVTDGQTSISAHTNDGGVPTDIAFSVAEKSSEPGGGGNGGENPDPGGEDPGQTTSTAEISFVPQQGVTLAVNGGIITFTDSESVSIGTVQVYMGNSIDAYTEYQIGDSEARLAIPEGTTTVNIVLKPEGELQAQLVYGGDIREAGAISDPVINEGTYTYTITVANIPENNNSGSKFVGITVEFGTNLGGGGEDFTSVIWNGDQVELTSDHGTISIASIEIGNNTYYYNSTAGEFIDVPEGLILECYYDEPTGESEVGESGVRIGDAAFAGNETLPKDPGFDQYAPQDGDPLRREDYNFKYEPWVYINFVFKPDYGYQVTGIGTNENPTSLVDAGFSAAETISTFRFPVYYRNMVHFVVLFSESSDVTDVTDAENVSDAFISDGENAAESGNLKLTVTDTETDNTIPNAVSTFDLTLQNIVSKGGDDEYWTTDITEFTDPITISLTLDTENFTAADYTVYREHDGEPEDLKATYDPETGELTFETNKFSEYTIVEKTSGGGNDSPEDPPYVPPVTPPIDTPTDEKVEIPVSGDDETIHVGATVSGDTVTVDEIDMGQLDGILGSDVDTGTVTIDFSGLDSTASVTTVELPANVVKEIAEAVNDPENDAESLEIIMSSGVSITFDADALSEKVSQADGADITISIESHEDADLTDAQKDAIGSRPAFDINVTSGGEHISDIGGKITIGAPYELKPDEKENGLVVWYVDNEGNRERCQGSYDPINKRMNWETDHLSLYMIDYCPSATFADLDIDAWYTDSTDFVIANGLMNGVGGDKFDPDGTTSRAMIVTILWRLEGSPIVNYAMDFEDVDAEQWYTEAIRWAASNKIVEGYGNGKFGTNDAITREQMVTTMWRYAKYKGYDVSVGENTNILSYGDAFDVAEWAIPAMQWACGSGMIQGIADGSTMNLQPQGNATRAQAAAILQRYVENVANAK